MHWNEGSESEVVHCRNMDCQTQRGMREVIVRLYTTGTGTARHTEKLGEVRLYTA